MNILIQISEMMIGGNRYKAFIDYEEDGKERKTELVSRISLRHLFYQMKEMFSDRLNDLCNAKIAGEFEMELTNDDLIFWETPISEVMKNDICL